jgi:RNA-directed DNA polymerase
MNSSQFKKYQLKQLCAIIGCKPYEVEYITRHIDSYYHEWIEEKRNKTTGKLKTYKDGTIKQRVMRPSLNRLKILQCAIKNKILMPILLPDNIHGGVKGKGNITNTKSHQGNPYQFSTDLKDFFPGITNEQVYKALLSVGFSHHFAYWITNLVTWKGQLPQGTPTSTHIANIVFLKVDKKLLALSNDYGLIYTRFVDDLTFSSQKDFKFILDTILTIIDQEGFKINYRKTDYKGMQTITGIDVFNNYIDAPDRIKAKVADELISADTNKPYTNYLNRIRKTNKGIRKKTSEINSAV